MYVIRTNPVRPQEEKEMEISSHYYAILAFCRARGFNAETAGKIAYASQYVDDATINLITVSNPSSCPGLDDIAGEKCLFNMATCHSYFRIKTFNYTSMIRNTAAFHFVPGCEGTTFAKKMRCKENSPVIRSMIDEAIPDGDCIQLGMLLHVYADTFSHQGFSGILSEVNNIDKLDSKEKIAKSFSEFVIGIKDWFGKSSLDKLFDKAVPGYGHAQAFTFPDEPYLVWSYVYDSSEDMTMKYETSGVINNPDRYKRAFEKITEYLDSYLAAHPEYRDASVSGISMTPLYDTLVASCPSDKRIKLWRALMVKMKLFREGDRALEYDGGEWLRKAFSDYDKNRFDAREVYKAVLSPDFEKSEWYQYYRAVRKYKKEFIERCGKCGCVISI